jgi:CBS domain containing-hemolysin-like protein
MEEKNMSYQGTEPEAAADEGYPGILSVRDVMTPIEHAAAASPAPADAVTVPAHTPVEAALRTMRAREAGSAVVVDDHDVPVGIVTIAELTSEVGG